MIPSKHKASAKRRPKSSSIPKHHDGKEYVVCLKDGIDYDKFWEEMETTIASPAEIPDRAVRIANERPNMKRICHYILTDEEAKRLRADGRVVSVDIPAGHKDGVTMMPHARQTGNFSKPVNMSLSTGNRINWGLIRGNTTDNIYGTENTIDTTYDYTLDGLGVDVVIVDTGIQADHPEFNDYNNSSRVQQINWFDASDTAPNNVQANNNDIDIVVSADSEIWFDKNNTSAGLFLGSSDLAIENFSVQTESINRALRMRYVGDSIWYREGLNDINWEVRLLDNNWMEVSILRHDAATRVDVEGIIQTSGDTSIVVKDIDTSNLYEGQFIRFGDSSNWTGYHGTVRELGTYDGSSLIHTYVIDYLENPGIGDLNDLIVGLRLERQIDLGGGSINGYALITELNLNGNEVNYTADGSTTSFLVADRPIDQRNIIVAVIGSLQNIYTDYNVVYDNGNTYIQFTYTPVETYEVNISFPPSLVFETTASCDQGPLVFSAYTGSGDDSVIDSIDSPTQITISGFDGGNINHGYAYMFVGSSDSNPYWSFDNEYGDTIIDLSDLADPSLFGPEATPVSFLLKTDNHGVNWTRQGGIGNNYRAVLDGSGHWVAQAGLATTVGAPLTTVQVDAYHDYTESNFTTPFPFKVPFTGFVPSLHYTDVAGHGTHVAGIAAGRTYGWAKNAHIYALKMRDLSGNGGLTQEEMFDAIIGWHNNKTNGRPTVVNLSWGYGGYYAGFDILGGSYRGLVWEDDVARPDYGMGYFGTFPIRNYSTDTGVEEMITAGIHVCISSGNDGVKIDVPGGPDYNNYFVFADGEGTDFYYYQKGSSPYSKHALMVGSLDLDTYDAARDRKADYSNGGPGTDIYAPGTGIMSSMSNVNTLADEGYFEAPFFLDGEYKQANLSGTSMASPQIAGMVALFLQANPHATPAEMKAWVLANAGHNMWDYNTNGMDYENGYSPWGGDNKVVYNKFNSQYSIWIRNNGD